MQLFMQGFFKRLIVTHRKQCLLCNLQSQPLVLWQAMPKCNSTCITFKILHYRGSVSLHARYFHGHKISDTTASKTEGTKTKWHVCTTGWWDCREGGNRHI